MKFIKPKNKRKDIIVLKDKQYVQYKIIEAYLDEVWKYKIDTTEPQYVTHEEILINLTTGKYNDTLKRKKVKVYEETSDEIRISKLLFTNMRQINPMYKEPDFQKWAIHIDNMINLDKRPPAMIEKVIELIFKDDFWKAQIQSTAKLRKQFDQLTMKFAVKMQNQQTKIENNKPIIC